MARTRTKTITGRTNRADILGLRVLHRTSEGDLEGIVERLEGLQPVIRFTDGRWTYGTSTLRVVDTGAVPAQTVHRDTPVTATNLAGHTFGAIYTAPATNGHIVLCTTTGTTVFATDITPIVS